jgi:hypothetical protein
MLLFKERQLEDKMLKIRRRIALRLLVLLLKGRHLEDIIERSMLSIYYKWPVKGAL